MSTPPDHSIRRKLKRKDHLSDTTPATENRHGVGSMENTHRLRSKRLQQLTVFDEKIIMVI
jgi:hypothetical protein